MNITTEYLASQGLSPTMPRRFWSKILVGAENNGCWPWTGAIRMAPPRDYGILSRGISGSSPISAHVASWILHFGPIPKGKGLCVCHHCDNSRCVRPDHLFLGTAQDNSDDKMRKGRYVHGKRKRGEECHSAKLTASQVIEVRKLSLSGERTSDIAKRFGVWDTTIDAIVKGRTWKHVSL